MTITTQPESKSPSRRALLAGALGGLGAWAASAVGRASPVQAANGDYVRVGFSLTGTAATALTVTGADGLRATATSNLTTALQGVSLGPYNGEGVWGQASGTQGVGIIGQAFGSLGRGVNGIANGGHIGVVGSSGGPVGDVPSKVGVLGHAAQDNSAIGVFGQSDPGTGVRGQATSGVGVYATAGSGYALRTNGRLKADKVSGVATITAGNISKTITPGVNVTDGSFVLLTPKVKLGGRDLWFTTDAANNKVTIRMSSSRSSGTKVAWLLLG
jgi:hypothetical protein